MRLSTTLALLLACLALLTAGAAQVPPSAAVNLWNYVHPETQVLIGIDWQKARVSPGGRLIGRQVAATGALQQASLPIGDLLDRIERILVTSHALPGAAPGAQPPMVAIVEGRFDKAAIKKLLPPGTATERFKGADLFAPPKGSGKDPLLAMVNDRLLLIGDRDSLGEALSNSTPMKDANLREKAMQMAGQCEIWLVSAASPGRPSGLNLPEMKQLEDIESMDLGIVLQKGLGLRLRLDTKNEDAARSFATMAQFLTTMVAQDKKQTPEMAAIVRSLNVKTEAKSVKLALDIPLATLEKGLTEMRASMKTAGPPTLEGLLGMRPQVGLPPGLQQTAQRPAYVPPPPPTPQKRTIRIVGSEEGTKEITYVK